MTKCSTLNVHGALVHSPPPHMESHCAPTEHTWCFYRQLYPHILQSVGAMVSFTTIIVNLCVLIKQTLNECNGKLVIGSHTCGEILISQPKWWRCFTFLSSTGSVKHHLRDTHEHLRHLKSSILCYPHKVSRKDHQIFPWIVNGALWKRYPSLCI